MADLFNPAVPGATVSPYPPELQQDARTLARRRAIADLLLTRTFAPTQQPTGPGGIPVPMSPFAALQPVAAGFLGALSQSKVDEGDKALATRYSTGLADATTQMLDKIKTGDYAAASQISSKWPALKTISEKLFERNLPDFQVSEGVGYNKNALAPASTAVPMQTYSPTTQSVTQPGGGTVEIPGSKASVTGKVTSPPANIFSVQNFPENKAATVFAEGQAELIKKKLEASHDKAQGAAGDLSILQPALEAYNQGVKTGSLVGLRNEIDKFAETAGFKSTDPKISNTDTMARQMAGRLLQHTKELRPMSDPDKKFLEEILGGRGLDAAGLDKLFSIGIENSVKNIDAHNSFVNQTAEAPGSLPSFRNLYRVNLPMTGAPTEENPEGVFRMQIGGPGAPAAGAPTPNAPIPTSSLSPAQIKGLQEWLKSLSPTAP